MQQEIFVEEVSTRQNPHVDPGLHFWGWEVPVYLFFGGLVAGLLVLYAAAELTGNRRKLPFSSRWGPFLALPLLGLGLFALFLDLEYKSHVLRFYGTLKLRSPMSWGSWILILVAVAALAPAWQSLCTEGRRRGWAWLRRPAWRNLQRFLNHRRKSMAWLNLSLGVALGIYTGILLSSLAARPVWSSTILGPLFLISGLSTGLALCAWLTRSKLERHFLVRLDLILIAVELLFLSLWLFGLSSGGEAARQAAQLFLGGPYTAVFWTLVVGAGLLVPALLETMAILRRWPETRVGLALILVGGLMLRFVLVDAGQAMGIGG
ncbi:MAG: nitrite reductase [Planctomycetota bacterium]|nr:MAG: nitrite reductase [Planctomycetota bacterium]